MKITFNFKVSPLKNLSSKIKNNSRKRKKTISIGLLITGKLRTHKEHFRPGTDENLENIKTEISLFEN